ncbi:HNH endonuclease [Microcoleus sp. LEGE 07076]|uniref:HNH endonuclease n=1 Tax=Microcoleus sp. LEGE 07076 TaxID=915322 RepID=UPI00187F1293|nr:HNH endonuclease [Microcoleus sp. LEGE 07076]
MSTGQEPENKNLAYYCKRFANLGVNKQKGSKAPHKPILLLSIIDLIAQGIINENQIYVSDNLLKTFEKYWNVLVASDLWEKGLYYPFIRMKTDGFWHITPKSGFKGSEPKTTNKLKEAVEYASLDSELFNLLQEPHYRAELIDTLIAAWFSSNRDDIGDILQVNQDFENVAQAETEISGLAGNIDAEPRFYLTKSAVRNAIFRKAVVHTYDYKCAFCRLKVIRNFTQNIVDGSHIKPFSKFYDNQINNGISLCKNHHWAFDQGWFAIDDNYRIIVANDLEEESPNARTMKDFHSETILLPSLDQYLPRLESLHWHRVNVFRA